MSWILQYFVDYGAAATAVQKKACRAAAAYAAVDAATATTAAAAASAVLLVNCRCAAAELLHLSHRGTSSPCSFKINMMLCFAMPTDLSFFRYEICIFCDLTEFRRFAHRKHIQSCLLYTSPSPRDRQKSRMPSSA